MNLIISHKNCSDGLCAAHVASEMLDNPKVHFYDHSSKTLDKVKQDEALIHDIKEAKEMFILDFSFSQEVIDYFFSLNPELKITVIDHHATAKEDFENSKASENENYHFYFNNNYCGGVLSYVYFVLNKDPSLYQGESDKEIPEFLKHVQDRDIWIWKEKEKSEPFCEMFHRNVKDLPTIKILFPFNSKLKCSTNVRNFIEQGTNIIDFKKSQINDLLKNKVEVSIKENGEEVKGYAINASLIFSSDLGNRLSYLDEEHKFAIIYAQEEVLKCSLRSHHDFDCSKIAKFFGGGGHKQASGFSLESMEDFLPIYEKLKEGLDITPKRTLKP